MRPSPSVQHRLAHLRVLVSAVVFSLLMAALSVAGVLADGGGGPNPH